MDYYQDAGLMPYLEKLNFHLVGFGCTTCIGNSGPLPEPVAEAVQSKQARRRGGAQRQSQLRRPHQSAGTANYLASPPLVVAYAIAGRIDIDLVEGAARHGRRRQEGLPEGHLADARKKCSNREGVTSASEMFQKQYAEVFEGDRELAAVCQFREGEIFEWDETSTYIKKPPYFDAMVDPSGADRGSDGDACAGDAWRLGHDRSHLSGWLDSRRQPGGQVSDRARREAGGLQFLRRAPRQSRGDGARHARQHPAAEPACSGYRRRLDDAHSQRREDVHLRASMKYQAEGVPLMIIAARSTARARRATGPRRAFCCWA